MPTAKHPDHHTVSVQFGPNWLTHRKTTFVCDHCGLRHTFGVGVRSLRGARLLSRLHKCHRFALLNHGLDRTVPYVVVGMGLATFAMSFTPGDTQYYVPSIWALLAVIWAWTGRKS